MAESVAFTATGIVELPEGEMPCEVTVGSDGLAVTGSDRSLVQWPAHIIGSVLREDYTIRVENVLDRGQCALRRFARRTDELEAALRRARANALAELMAPPGATAMDVFEAAGSCPGLLYRYEDGLRWVPHEGDCGARLYSELDEAAFDDDAYELFLTGPFGQTRIGGLRRLTRELVSETARHIDLARKGFADALEAAGLPWTSDARTGALRAHVSFRATAERISKISSSGIICDDRREYWDVIMDEGTLERVVLSPDGERVRIVALCRAREGELYEDLSETDHASFVFASADDVVQAWTEVGFRREPIFSPADGDAADALARVLPSLNQARRGLVQRVVHDEPGHWRERLF